MGKTLITVSILLLLNSCGVYKKSFYCREKNSDQIITKDSSVISITYMEYFINTSEKHVGSSIWIKCDHILKSPMEIDIDSLKKIQTEYFSLSSPKVDTNVGGIQKVILFIFQVVWQLLQPYIIKVLILGNQVLKSM